MDDRPFNNPQPIDDSTLERIESGELDLTDKLFFKLIRQTPLYLGHWPFQKRIAQWQYCLNNLLYSDVEQRDASDTEQEEAEIRKAEKKRGKEKARPDW
jgi:hypothetical protein